MKKKEKYPDVTLTVERYGSDGEGVAHLDDGMACFVTGALRGEVCRVRLNKVGRTCAWGEVAQVLQPSDARVDGDCPYADRCGGCTLRHMTYEEELALKKQKVQDALKRIGGTDVEVSRIFGAENTLRYRNKVQFPTAPGPVIGFYRKRTHDVTDVEDCLLQPVAAANLRCAVKEWMERYQVSAYDERAHSGLVRHVYVRTNAAGESLCCLMVNGKELPHEEELVETLRRAESGLRGVVLGVNEKKTNVILGDSYRTLWGQDALEETLCGLRFRLSVPSFFQVNRDQTEVLYSKALELADLTGGETVVDLYCGIGTISLALAKKAGRVIGAEVVPEAIEDAKANAARNGIENAEFFCGDAEDIAAELAQKGLRPDVITVDPPRKGLAPGVVDAIVKMGPQRVVYVSCDCATLARDIKRFGEQGYQPQTALTVDLFPRTPHIESVVCLSREKADDVIKESTMISDERSKYKSWSNLKKQMNDLLCESLKDKISYFYTSYHEVHNAYGRATINYCKKEMAAFSWVEMYKQEQEVSQLYSEGKKVSYGEMEMKKWMPECKLCDADFIHSLTIYLKTDIASALQSNNYLLRVFAYMDRRVGKRTLVKIKDEVEKLPEWVKQFYQLRCEAEGIVFPPKRITDETVCLLSKV